MRGHAGLTMFGVSRHSGLTGLFVFVGLLGLAGDARADVPPMPAPGRRLVETRVGLEGLTDPDWVIVAFPANQRAIGTHAVFSASTPEVVFRLDVEMHGANTRLLSRAAYEAWSREVRTQVAAQREDCYSRNVGCVHPSRFSPTYPPPEAGIDCGLQLDVRSDGPEDGPAEARHRIRVVALTADACRLETIASPSSPPRAGGGGVPGCGAAGAAGLLAALAGLLVARNRRTGT